VDSARAASSCSAALILCRVGQVPLGMPLVVYLFSSPEPADTDHVFCPTHGADMVEEAFSRRSNLSEAENTSEELKPALECGIRPYLAPSRRSHKPKVAGSNPAPATGERPWKRSPSR
jgi:hypothetical protein